MIASEEFKMRISPEHKKMLAVIAKREGRSRSNLLHRLIEERYQEVQSVKKQHPAQPINQPMAQV